MVAQKGSPSDERLTGLEFEPRLHLELLLSFIFLLISIRNVLLIESFKEVHLVSGIYFI